MQFYFVGGDENGCSPIKIEVAKDIEARTNNLQTHNPLELERRLLGRSVAETRLVEADFAHVHIELRRKGVTLVLLWQEYRAANEGRRTWAYTQFCEHYKAFAKTPKRSMRQHRRAGEKLFIDYAGPTLELTDGTGANLCRCHGRVELSTEEKPVAGDRDEKHGKACSHVAMHQAKDPCRKSQRQ